MKTYEELKTLLTQIKENDFTVAREVDVSDLIDNMLHFIGHTDAELRDGLIYSTFNSWVDNGTLTPAFMRHILHTCLGETHLFYRIGEQDTDSVFTRTFSSLAIALAFAVHEKTAFLTVEDVHTIEDAILRYVQLEKDYRSYVEGKGWAHAVAHIADALANVVGCEIDGAYPLKRDDLLAVLQAVKTLVCNKNNVYTAEEDERLVRVVNAACCNNMLSNDDLVAWLDSFNFHVSNAWWEGTIPNDFYMHVNIKHFMRSLYFNFLSCGDNKWNSVYAKTIYKYL
ncbi:MAG: DUF2785 domain-containing protein [Defluviitaleaceae bacterium]|nr:DUF2785 domain-containing protein [Defluviitaleaceae bacterium]MCL2273758.1 DUF2785 domain-containing protein [Defluviitaleaceae bacterium]